MYSPTTAGTVPSCFNSSSRQAPFSVSVTWRSSNLPGLRVGSVMGCAAGSSCHGEISHGINDPSALRRRIKGTTTRVHPSRSHGADKITHRRARQHGQAVALRLQRR